MPSVVRSAKTPAQAEQEEFRKNEMAQARWTTVHGGMAPADFEANFAFLNDAVVMRGGREGVPYMTTTGIYGPLKPDMTVKLTPDEQAGIDVLPVSAKPSGPSLVEELEALYTASKGNPPSDAVSALVKGVWISLAEGGLIADLSASANVFGGTGQLIMKQDRLVLPVLEPTDPRYAETLAFYGGKLLPPHTPFYMGFTQDLFGMEYSGTLPNYLEGYVMQEFGGGGGLFVEVHGFPHIWVPRPDANRKVSTTSKITLGRRLNPDDAKDPQYRFTTFRVPSDGSALTIRPMTIHNDSYTNGPETVWLADVKANTVAIRKSAPFPDIYLQDEYYEGLL